MISFPPFVAGIAILAGVFVANNRMLLGLSTGTLQDEFIPFITTKDDVLDYYLEKYQKQIGHDYEAYRGHCLRVLTFTKYFLSLDNIRLEPREFHIISMALAYHDIGLWIDNKLNYLELSVTEMNRRVVEEMALSKQEGEGDNGAPYIPIRFHWSTFEEDKDIASAIILEHHKFTTYNYSKNQNEQNRQQPVALENKNEIVNAVRKADWADATMGIIRFGLPQNLLEAAYNVIPDAGFHSLLLNMGSRLSPNSLTGQMEVLKILKW